MFDKKKYQELVNERVNTDWEYKIDKICEDLITMITEDDCAFNDFIEYMQNDMTAEEYIYLSEISDEISQIKPSHKFVEAYRGVSFKISKRNKRLSNYEFYRSCGSLG